jgi:CheY-like chemotaxis protein
MTSQASTIYIVDDDPAVLHSTRFLLESEGHPVAAFASGQELLAAFPGPSPALVLLDHLMPDIDGLEVWRRLARIGPERTVRGQRAPSPSD